MPLPRNRLRLRRLNTPWQRLLGLMLRRYPPGPRSGVWLRPCWAVHTFGMRYPIDVAFIDSRGKVLKFVTLPPWCAAICVGAASVIETRVGCVDTKHSPICYVEAAIQHATDCNIR